LQLAVGRVEVTADLAERRLEDDGGRADVVRE